jgi:hypothetical protein
VPPLRVLLDPIAVHELVTASLDAGARLAAGGTYERLFYRPTVLISLRGSASRTRPWCPYATLH